MDVGIDNFVLLNLEGQVLAQEITRGFGLGEGDLVFKLAISRVARNLEQKTMSLTYREMDYFFHRKNDTVLIFGIQKNSLDKRQIRRIFNNLLEESNLELLLSRTGINFEGLSDNMDQFVPVFANALHQELNFHYRPTHSVTGHEVSNVELQ